MILASMKCHSGLIPLPGNKKFFDWEETHYYPFGLTMAGISGKAMAYGSPENKYKYNGIEKERDLGLEVYDAQFRELDAQVGRWWQIDPVTDGYEDISPYASMYNNPLTYSDPLGDEGQECCGDFLNALGNAVEDLLISAIGVVNGAVNTVSFGLISSDPFGMRDKLSGDKLELYNNSVTVGKVGALFMPGPSSAKTPPLEVVPVGGPGRTIPIAVEPTIPIVPIVNTQSGSNSSSGKGTQNPKTKEAVDKGNAAHKDFSQKAGKKGWAVNPSLKDPLTGKTVKPDAVTKSGKPVELKPNTPSGKTKGAKQLPKYERATGQKGRVVTYDPKKY
jgi:RHS repeat-associated protein